MGQTRRLAAILAADVGIAMTEHAEQRLRFKLIRRRTKHAQRSKTYRSRPHRRHEGATAAAYRQPRQTRSRAGWERSAWGNSAWRRECRAGSFGPARYESPTKKVIPHSCAARSRDKHFPRQPSCWGSSGTSGLEPHSRNRKRICSAMRAIMRYWRGGKVGPSEAVSSQQPSRSNRA